MFKKCKKIYIYIVLNGLHWYLKKKLLPYFFVSTAGKTGLNLGTFNFKVCFLRMDIYREISRTGHPIKLIFFNMLCILGVFWILGKQNFEFFIFRAWIFIFSWKVTIIWPPPTFFYRKMRKINKLKICFLRIQNTPKIDSISIN